MRSFKTLTGREYKEHLEARDDQNHLYKYSLVEVKPSIPSLTSIITTVKISAKSTTETLIDWSAEIEVDQTFAEQIVSVQQKAYTEAINALNKYFQTLQETILAFIENFQDEIKSQLLQIMKQHVGSEDEKYEYERYPRRKDAPNLPMEEFPRMVKGLPPREALPPKKLGLLSERIAEYVYSEIGFIERRIVPHLRD